MPIRTATGSDAEALTALINRAFAVERFFVDSDRITLERVRQFLSSGIFLIAEDAGGPAAAPEACIYIEMRGGRGYFGLLSVDPACQGTGLGKLLIREAEAYCRAAGCRFMDLQIVNLRQELPAYYGKLGYVETGTAPFTSGVDTKLPCHFVKMSKRL